MSMATRDTRQGAESPFSQTFRSALAQPFSESHIRFLAESLPEIVWTAWPDGTHDFMNHRWFAYTGLTEEETYGELKTAVHPDDFQMYKDLWKRSIETGEPYEVAYRFRRASDGMYRWHIGRAMPIKDPHGTIIKWFGVCVDIHAQKEAEEQIRKMNEELESTVQARTYDLEKEVRQRRRAEERHREHSEILSKMIELFPKAVVVADTNGNLLHANSRFYELLGIVRDSPTHLPPHYVGVLAALYRRFKKEDCDAAVARIQTNAASFRQEMTAQDGRIFSFEYVPSNGASDSGFLLSIRDISEDKKIEKAKSEFVSLASHQLRTPLTAIRWGLSRLSRLLKGNVSSEAQQLVGKVRSSAITMSQTISTMLAISRIEAGLHAVHPTDINLWKLLSAIGDEFTIPANQNQVALQVSCSSRLQLHTDESMLRQIVENLVANAVKYTPAGGSVLVTAEQKNNETVISVRDTGYGIPAHQQKKVFSKFFRGDNIIQHDTDGTGLGLYLVSQLAETLKANISFVSEEGKGTEFRLTFAA